MKQDKDKSAVTPITIVAAIILIIVFSYTALSSTRLANKDSNHVPSPGETVESLRGPYAAIITNVTQEPYFGVTVLTDQRIFYYPYPADSSDTIYRRLSPTEWRDFERFLEAFCFSEDAALNNKSESPQDFYDFVARCNNGGYQVNRYGVKQVKIQPKLLPVFVQEAADAIQTDK